jgi:hypothetical protein
MPATWSTYQNAMKEVWPVDHIVSQLGVDNELIDRVEKTSKYTVGEYAVVPTKTARPGGTTFAPNTGSSALNAAGSTTIGQPQYSLTYRYQPVKIEHAAIVSTAGKASAVANVIDTEMENAVEELKTQISRELYGNGDSLIAQCGTTSASTTVVLNATTGQDALLRQWLHPGSVIDIGTTGSESTIAADVSITSVTKSTTSPSIVISGSAVTTSSSHYVSIANARSGATSYEANGLSNVISTSASLGGVSAGGQWQAATVDSSTTTLTLDAMLAVQEAIMQETGTINVDVLTSFHQMRNFYNLFQNQVRFQSDSAIEAGNTDAIKWNGMTVRGQYHCPSSKMFFVNFEDLLLVTGSNGLHWLDEAFGSGNRLSNNPNTTAFTGTLSYPLNLAATRRVSGAALTALA